MTVSRRQVIRGGVLGSTLAMLLSACSSVLPKGVRRASSTPAGATRHVYGDDASQFGDLYAPTGTRRAGTVVLIHGGYWKSSYGLDLMSPLALDLAARGWITWNLEYRRVGNGGGWPYTLADVAAGIDALAASDLGADTSQLAVIGHSAGGQLAAWAAGRHRLPSSAPGESPKVAVTSVISLAGVLDLKTAFQQNLGGGAVAQLLGGTPTSQPTRFAESDPLELLPLGVPVRCIHGRSDDIVPMNQSQKYVDAAKAAGDDAQLTRVSGDHFTVIDPASAAWKTTVSQLDALMS